VKPPNHGLRVKVTDPFLTWTGYLIYAPSRRLEIDLGLRLRCDWPNPSEGVIPLFPGDRITLLP
jgi:hypothetical protein